MNRLKDKVALITGAGSGIGAACAKIFAEQGATVVGLDLADSQHEDWLATLQLQCKSFMLCGSVTDETALNDAVAQVVERLGRVDILVNSAGTYGGGAVHQMPTEEFDRVLDINLKGTFLACRSVLKPMIRQRAGSIINIASVEGVMGGELTAAYNASKGGVILLTKNLAVDYGRVGIRANSVCPGFIATPMTAVIDSDELQAAIANMHQLGRMGLAREVAQAVLFLASDEASFVTGSELMVDGGFTAGKRFSLDEKWSVDEIDA